MKGILLLSDGTIFEGEAKGYLENSVGEVVFNTSMTGVQEMITDPSYYGQIITTTFPVIGGPGINDEDFSSEYCVIRGLIAKEICDFPNNFRCKKTLEEYLVENKIVALTGIDTRALTKILRDKGTMNGEIIVGEYNDEFIKNELNKINNYKIENPISYVTVKSNKNINYDNSKYNVLLWDLGHKNDVITSLKNSDCNVTVVPCDVTFEEIKRINPDGILISNGPGNPKDNADIINTLKEVIELNIPMLGIGLGHQLIALAMGFDTKKMKYGHRGGSIPVKCLENGRTYITGQNHGYEVDMDSVSDNTAKITHVNINDNSVEGIKYNAYPIISVQFHPYMFENKKDKTLSFNEFVDMMEGNKNANK